VVGAQAAQLAFAALDLAVELVDQSQAGLERPLPRLRQCQPGEQPAAADTEEIGDGAGLTVREQDGVHPLLQARAVTDEVQPPTRSLPLCAHQRIGQPDRWHQVTPRELGQHPGVDPVGLAGQRCEALDLLCIGDLDLPTGRLELVVHEARPVHRLDRRADRLAVTVEPSHQSVQATGIRRRRTDFDRRTLGVEQMKVEALATEIQTGVQH